MIRSGRWTGVVRFSLADFLAPLRATRSQLIFEDSMSDWFFDEVPEEWLLALAEMVTAANWHVHMILTKLAERMRQMLESSMRFALCSHICREA